jgi:hypothetical protein
MLATHHTDFESFTNALGTLPNHPPVPMACEPSPSPIDVDTKAIVQQVVDVLLKHSPSPAVHLEVLGRRWLALARNESVTNLTSTLSPAKVPAMNKRDKREDCESDARQQEQPAPRLLGGCVDALES